MKTIMEVIVYCKKRSKEYQDEWDNAPDHNESTDWYLEPVAHAFQEVIDFIEKGIDESGLL